MSTVDTPARPGTPRVSRRLGVVVTAVLALLVLAVTGHQLSTVRWGAILDGLDWWMLPTAAAATVASVLGAAWNLVGFSPARLTLRRATAAQLAGTALKVVTPASVGTVAVNARVVHTSGARPAAAVLAVAAAQAAQLVVTVVLVVLVALTDRGAGAELSTPRVPAVVAGAVTAALLLLLVTRRWWWRLVPLTATARFRDVGPQLLAVVRSPRRSLAGFGGCVLLTAGLVAALWACVRATGGQLTLLAVLVVLLAGTALGNTVPTPGGVGGVEAAMTTGLVTAGLSLGQALPAVVLYRVLTFWLLVPLGTLAAAGLRRRSLL